MGNYCKFVMSLCEHLAQTYRKVLLEKNEQFNKLNYSTK